MENNEEHSIKFSLSVKLWWINSWLRFTGFRIFWGQHKDDEGEIEWTKIGIGWFGWPNNWMEEVEE